LKLDSLFHLGDFGTLLYVWIKVSNTNASVLDANIQMRTENNEFASGIRNLNEVETGLKFSVKLSNGSLS